MTKTVLCVDDSATMQKVAEISLRGTGFTYSGARSANEALQKAQVQKPVLILADAVMPGASGYDLCRTLKSNPNTATIPVVLLCGNSQPYDEAKGAQVGANGQISKPWDTEVFLKKISEFAGAGAAAAPQVTPTASPSAPTPPPMARAPSIDAANRSSTIMGLPKVELPSVGTAAPARPINPSTPPRPPTGIPDIPVRKPSQARPPSAAPGQSPPQRRPSQAGVLPPVPGQPAPARAPSQAPRAPSQAPKQRPPAAGQARPRRAPMIKARPTRTSAPPPVGQPQGQSQPPQGRPARSTNPPPGRPKRTSAPMPVTSPAGASTAGGTADHRAATRAVDGGPTGRPQGGPPAPIDQSSGIPMAVPRANSAAQTSGSIESRVASKVAQSPELQSAGINSQQVAAIASLSRDIIEQVVWEVVPELAETIIRENLDRLTKK